MSLFSTLFFGGHGCGGNDMALLSSFYAEANLVTASKFASSNIFGGGFFSDISAAAQSPSPSVSSSCNCNCGSVTSETVTKDEVNRAYNEYMRFVDMAKKIEAYKRDTSKTKAALENAVSKADGELKAASDGVSKCQGELSNLRQARSAINKKNKVIIVAGQFKNAEDLDKAILAKENELTELQRTEKAKIDALEKAQNDLTAFNIARDKDQTEYENIIKDKDIAYATYQDLNNQYIQEQAQIRAAREAAEKAACNKAQDKSASGKWWHRSKLNPKNWFNHSYGFWGKDNSNANIAKCLRILKSSGRDAAREYAVKQGLITPNYDSNYNIIDYTAKDSSLNDLCLLS